jgi:hypothetical protein
MLVIRIFALIMIAAALMLLGADALSSLEAGAVSLRTTAGFWEILHAGSLSGFTGWLAGLPNWLSATGSFILNAPAWSVFGVVGIVLGVIAGQHG